METPIKCTPDSGSRRAALRVKQKLRQDRMQWSPNGMRRRPKLARPRSSRRSSAQHCLNHKPWNDRFIFDEELRSKECNAPAKSWKRSANGKGDKNPVARSQMRHYTERSDGEAVTEFSLCEIFPSSPVAAATTCLSLINMHSVGISPFDMAKVRAALEDDAINNHEDDELHHDNDHDILKDESKRLPLHKFMEKVLDPDFAPSGNGKSESGENEKRPHHGPLFLLPLDENAAKSLLEKFEELLYTFELEVELLQRDLVKNRLDGNDCITYVICDENEGDWLQTPVIPTQRQDEIREYVTKKGKYQDLQHELLMKNGELQYDEILASLAESILERIIEDIVGEINEAVVDEMGNIVSNL